MAPMRTTARMGSLLASTHTPRSLPPPSSPSTAPITPALALRRISRVLLASLTKRDDDTTTVSISQSNLKIIFPAIVGFFILCIFWGGTREHFRKGGTWPAYFKSLGKAVFYFLLLSVLLPFTILGCLIHCHRASKKQQNRVPGQARPLQPANNPHRNHEPPPVNRPQMSLNPVVLLPDQPDLEDPDAVERVATLTDALPQPPPPVQQKPESTAEATATMLNDKDGKTGA